MARNLQSKLGEADVVRVFDVNKDTVRRFAEDVQTSSTGGASIEMAESTAEAARDSVSPPSKHSHSPL